MAAMGILGGTFDPIHLGHLATADVALGCAGLHGVVIIPAARPPHKEPPGASARDRFEMCRLAAETDPRLSVSDLELSREGPSYTYDTLVGFRRRNDGEQASLILGWDAAREIRSWHRWQDVVALAPIVLVSRPTLPAPLEADLVGAGLRPERVTLCLEPTPDIRATDIRRLAREGASLDGLVPPSVEGYIREHGLYGYRRP